LVKYKPFIKKPFPQDRFFVGVDFVGDWIIFVAVKRGNPLPLLAQWRLKTDVYVQVCGTYIYIFFASLMKYSKTTMKELIELSEKTITIVRNEFLKAKGSIDTNLYFIESGSLRVFVLDDSEEQVIRFGYKENLIVSLDSFLSGKPSDLVIQAIKKTVIKVISKSQIETFLKRETKRILWTKILENLVLQQMEREIDILTNSPKERYKRVLKRSPQLFQEIPLKHIANYLRMSAETLSRLKKS